MKASEITQPGLYWACQDGADGVRMVVNVVAPCGGLLMEWHGDDDAHDLKHGGLKHLADFNFIGPFPPPGEGPKFDGFKAALEALCRAYGVRLEADYAQLFVHDAESSDDSPLCGAYLDDRTKP